MFYRKIWSKNFLKDICNPSKMRPLNFEGKNGTGCLLNFYEINPHIFQWFSKDTLKKNMDFIPMKSDKNQSNSWNNSGVITSQFESTNLAKARKSTKHSSFSVKYCKCLFLFLIISPHLSVHRTASFSPQLSFVRNFPELPGHVRYHFTYVNNISSLKTGVIPLFA